MRVPNFALVLLTAILSFGHPQHALPQQVESGHIRLRVSDTQGTLIPCRVHLRDADGKPHRPSELPFWKEHFVCRGEIDLELAPGEYRWEIERGPEFRPFSAVWDVKAESNADVKLTLQRVASLRDEGWFSGDLHIHRDIKDIELLMEAEDLDFGPVIEWWNMPAPNAVPIERTEFPFGQGRIYTKMAGEDEREGGALLFFGLQQPLDLTVRSREFPAPLKFVNRARELSSDVWIDIEKPFWWDVPTWVAIVQPDSIGIAHNHMHRGGVLPNEAWGKSRDMQNLPGTEGNGLWTQQIYYHLLNCGLRLPPSAGSASGVLPNPVGYNRVYVWLGDAEFTSKNWFAGLKAGRCFVTNGPLLRVRANGQLPGAELDVQPGKEIDLELLLTSNDLVRCVEIVQNGRVVETIPWNAANSRERVTWVPEETGWFLVRAIADVDHTFRFASTAPWYAARDNEPVRISQKSTQFFLNWIEERIERVRQNVPDPLERQSVLRWHFQAQDFWKERLAAANVDLSPHVDLTWQEVKARLLRTLQDFERSEQRDACLAHLVQSTDAETLRKAVEPLTLLKVVINPESRVKVNALHAKIRLQHGSAKKYLLHVENTAGITAPLHLSTADLAVDPPQKAIWCNVEILPSTDFPVLLSGAPSEFKIVEFTSDAEGLREVRIVGDAGQGTQDLGFRATTDILIETQSKAGNNERN